MADFLLVSTRSPKKGVIEIFPRFIIKRSADLMIRGGDFYAVWLKEKGLWSTDEQDALQLIDRELEKYHSENHEKLEVYGEVRVLYMWDASSGMIDIWHKYCQKQLRDNYHMLDEKLIFADTEVNKKDYASKRLSYALEEGNCDAYDKLISTLYTEEERHKIEWAIGAVISGDSKKIQKFMVLYGAAGTGKSTILHIIEDLFEGYCSGFTSSELGKSNSAFALEAFRNNPLVAIEHDGDLSRVEDNTRLNSLVSHEKMIVNEKFKSNYENAFKAFLFIGTNKPVKITDAKSGLLRRLIDVSPSGEKLSVREYNKLMRHVKFELGAIAFHCLKVYQSAPDKYDNYIPLSMMGATNDFYNFVSDSYFVFKRDDMTTLKAAWEMYKNYCDDARVPYPFSQKVFKEELKNYFVEYKERGTSKDGTRIRSCYIGFRLDKFEEQDEPQEAEPEEKSWIEMKEQPSEFDRLYSDAVAQYATDKGSPQQPWSEVKTTLKDISTDRLHYIRVPLCHVVVDFDLTDESGNKCLSRNLEAASKFPPTYAELSRSGRAVHLHYIYDGDVSKLDPKYAEHIEVKVFSGKSALRRKLTKCNDLPIAHISSGLPMKGEKMINFDGVKNERQLRRMIKKNLNKEYHAATKPSICFIDKLLQDAYKSGMPYDVTDMRNAILVFAASSTNQSEYCIKLVNDMKFKSEDASVNVDSDDERIVFYDCEVFPNLFLVNWKYAGEGKKVIRMINPKPAEIEALIKHRLVGFNCRRYDNHMLYACLMGYNNEQLYNLSQRIISGSPNCFFGEAYNISYTDVYDFSSKKQSLKKFEIELGIHHQELGLPWDKPVPKEMWERVAEYCDNDVIATEAVFNARKADFVAREILADVAGMTVNDTTNSLTTRIIFGRERKPQGKFNYRNMGDMSEAPSDITDVYTVFNKKGQPIFPGYKFEFNKSIYRGEEVGEGGYVYAEPGVYHNVALLDIASMHPSSIVAENLFGDEYTRRFKDILDARLAIKHKDFDKARKMLGGALAKYLSDEGTAKDLAQALKIAINSVYGLTMASFDSPFRDKRNVDNIVAKRGALFMVNLKHEVQKRGFTVAHIKTDSIKIPGATPEIISFVTEYGKLYGYNFEHEATYEKMCLVNDAVYIAKYDGGDWTATGTQFQVPYVFKTLFSKEPIEFEDMCETKQVSTALYLDMNEDLPDVSEYEKEFAEQVKVMKGEADIILQSFCDEETLSLLSPDLKAKVKHSFELKREIAKGHNYTFVGRVGRFCPIRPGCGGGVLLREAKDKKTGATIYAAATGSKGYRWLESETVKRRDISIIDRSYYDRLVEGAVEAITKYDDVRIFAEIDSEDKNIRPEIQEILDNYEYLPF